MLQAPKPINRRLVLQFTIGLCLLTVLAFWRVGDCGFTNYDDDQYLNNSIVRGGLSLPAVQRAFTTTRLRLWHPLTFVSLMLDHEMFGEAPAGYHLVNLAFHVTNVTLLFLWLTSVTASIWRSALLSAVFAIHPLRVESVAWVAERKDVLCHFFALLCLCEYAAYIRRPSVRPYLLSLTCLALSLMAKPMFVTMPVLLFLLDWWPLRRFGAGAEPSGRAAISLSSGQPGQRRMTWLILEKLPFLALGIASTAVTLFAHLSSIDPAGPARSHQDNWYHSYPFSARVGNAIVSCVRYLWKLVDVRHLAVFYPMPASWPLWQVGLCAGFLVTVTLLVIRWRRSKPWLLVGWLWYLVALIPVLGVLTQVGQYAMADRYTYFPTVGIVLMVIWSIPQRWAENSRIRTGLQVTAGAVLAALAVATYIQIGYWHDSVPLFQHAIDSTGDNPQANTNLAWALLNQKHFKEAHFHGREVLRLRPGARDAGAVCGMALEKMGQPLEAIILYRETLQYHPDDDEILTTLGRALFNQSGQLLEAADRLRSTAIAAGPYADQIFAGLGKSLCELSEQDDAEAIDCFRRALAANPKNTAAHQGLAIEFLRQAQHPVTVDPNLQDPVK